MIFKEFDIVPGEHVAIVGDNGSGKTLLAESLLRRHPFDSEYISFRDSYGDEADGAYYYQLRWNRQELANHIELGQEAKDLYSLSSGELRKHRLARALASEARFLIIDNPYLGLDAASREVFTESLARIAAEGSRSIILVMPGTAIMPEFLTHVAVVRSVDMVEKFCVEEVRGDGVVMDGRGSGVSDGLGAWASDGLEAGLSEERREAIKALPIKDLSGVRFYPSGNDVVSAGGGLRSRDVGMAGDGTACDAGDGIASDAGGGGGVEIVRCNAVSIRYDGRTILDSLDWVVHEGEHWAVRGENGAGKSTLLSLVCADNPQAYACNIELFGHKRGSGESIWDIKRHIGYVSPEMHRAYKKNITALEAVSSGFFDTVGMYRRADEAQQEISRRWMWIFGIDALSDRPYLKLSSGEQRLCLLARAFVKDPELLVLDEPMHGLDERNCILARQIIDEFVQRPHKTLLFVTHFDSELPSCIDHTLLLRKH